MTGPFKPRWYTGSTSRMRSVPVQMEHDAVLPEEIARMAYAEYAHSNGDQSYERLHARSGFGWAEVAYLLADAMERQAHGHKVKLLEIHSQAIEAGRELGERVAAIEAGHVVHCADCGGSGQCPGPGAGAGRHRPYPIDAVIRAGDDPGARGGKHG